MQSTISCMKMPPSAESPPLPEISKAKRARARTKIYIAAVHPPVRGAAYMDCITSRCM